MNWFSQKVYESLVKRRHVKVSEHFYLWEVDCRDGSPVPFNLLNEYAIPLAKNLEVIRALYDKPMHVNSWYRTKAYNDSLPNSAPTSQHLKANACDFWFAEVHPTEVHEGIEKLIRDGKLPNGGLGLYDGFIHYDNRGKAARWDFRTKK